MTSTISLSIITPVREVYHADVAGMTVPTIDGQITVLPHHMPIATTLKAGELMIHLSDGREEPFAIGGGFLEVHPDKLVVLADTAEHIAEIDEQRVHDAIARAEQLKSELTHEHVEYAGMAAKLERDLARLHVVRKHKHHGHHGLPYEGVRKD